MKTQKKLTEDERTEMDADIELQDIEAVIGNLKPN